MTTGNLPIAQHVAQFIVTSPYGALVGIMLIVACALILLAVCEYIRVTRNIQRKERERWHSLH